MKNLTLGVAGIGLLLGVVAVVVALQARAESSLAVAAPVYAATGNRKHHLN